MVVLDQQEQNDKLLEQFGRQILVPGVDEEGQLQLSQRKICIIGIGALGTIASQYLVRSGIGSIHLIYPDVIEESNLHRQINYTLDDLGKYKSEVSKNILKNINEVTSLKSYSISFEEYLKTNSIDTFDLVLD